MATSARIDMALERARMEIVRTGSRGVIFAIETGRHYWRNLAYFLDESGLPSLSKGASSSPL